MNSVIWLVARREIVSRVQQRGYRIGFFVTIGIVIVACLLPGLLSGGSDGPERYDVGVATSATDDPTLTATLRASSDPKFTVRPIDADEARAAVDSGRLDAVVLPGRLVAKDAGADVVAPLRAAVARSTLATTLRQAGASESETRRALNPPALALTTTEPAANTQRQVIGIATVVLLFAQLTTFCTWVATGVVEEKASRVVELVLATIRPLQLLAGKLLGIGLLAAGQTLAVGVAAVAAGSASGALSIPASAVTVLVAGFVGFVLGFALFAALAAALASTVSRQEEVSGILAPVTISLLVCYGASFAATSNPDSTLGRLASVIPPFSAIAMPGRIARGDVPVSQIVLAVALLVVVAAALLYVAARIYRASVLHSGSRVSLATAWRGEAVADLT